MSLIVNTKYGKVEGFEEDNMYKWFGIPFAKPPIGELRFKRAISLESWSGVRECKVMGNRPYQFANDMMLKMLGTKHPMSEDCLYLNIWAPKDAQKVPVFVWIYGGANHVGEASSPDYFCDSFPRDGIIGVNFNYRVGPFGFYDFSKLDSSFDSNCAVSDMVMALRWIKDNISAFGGDPDNITICGESAGGTAVYSMLSAPVARGTFNKAIAMSGLPGNVNSYRTHELNNTLFFRTLGMSPENVAELKTMSYEKMLPGGIAVFDECNKNYPGILVTGPVIDDLIPQQPWEALASGLSKDVTCIFGTCHDEGTMFYMTNNIPRSWNEVEKMLQNSGCPEKFSMLKELYYGMSEKEAMEAIGRERLFWTDSIKCTLAQCEYNTTYSYRYDFVSFLMKEAGLNAVHGSDVCSALDTWKGYLSENEKQTPMERLLRIHNNMHGAYVNFIKTGNPNGDLPLEWQSYDYEKRATFIFNDECLVEHDPNRKYFEVWKDIELYREEIQK